MAQFRHIILTFITILFFTQVLSAQKIRVGIYDNPPKIYTKSDGSAAGLFPDLLAVIAEKEGWEIEYIKGSWQECLQNLENGTIDVVPDIAYSKERAEKYCYTNQTVFVNWGGLFFKPSAAVSSLSGLADKRVAVNKGSIHTNGDNGIKTVLREMGIDVTYIEVDSYSKALQAVLDGDADVAAVNQLFGEQKKATLGLHSSTIVFNPIELKFAALNSSAHCHSLFKTIDLHIAAMKNNNGRYRYSFDEIVSKNLRGSMHGKKVLRSSSFFGLSEEDEKWLQKHPVIQVGVDQDYAPYSFRSTSGEYIGIVPDLLAYIESRSALNFRIVPNLTWSEVLNSLKYKQLDMVTTIVPTEERKAYALFTPEYLPTPLVIMGRVDDSLLQTQEDLKGKTVALIKNYSSSERVAKENPDITELWVETPLEALEAVAIKRADACIGVLGINLYMSKKHGLSNLRIVSNYGEKHNGQCFAVRKDWARLQSIMTKVLQKIPEEKQIQIFNTWIPVSQNKKHQKILKLTTDEQAFISEHPVLNVAVDPSLAPLEYLDNRNSLQGVTADLLALIASRTGLVFDHIQSKSWAENIELMKQGRVDVFACITNTKERRKYLRFTNAYKYYPRMVFARENEAHLADLKVLKEKRLCLIKGYATSDYLKEQGLVERFIEVENTEDALMAVSKGDADIFVGFLLTSTYEMQNHGISNIKVIGELPHKAPISMACRKEFTVLQGILEKALESISEEEWNEIYRKWYSVKIEHGNDYGMVWKISLISLLIVGVFFFWNRSLKEQIIKRKAAEKRLIEETAEKECLIHMIIHDMRSPLQVLQSYVDLYTLSDGELDEESVTLMKANIDTLIRMVSDVIDTQKMEEKGLVLKKEEVDIISLFKDIVSKMEILRKDIAIKITPCGTVNSVFCDKKIVARVFQNIVSNSLKYTKGEVLIEIAFSSSEVRIEVKDDGPGIAKKYQDVIFEKYGQVIEKKSVGMSTGLGLTFCKLGVVGHDGNIGVESEVGKGSTFWFTLPI